MSSFPCIPMPEGIAKEEILDLLQREMFGFLPEAPTEVCVEAVSCDESFCAGKARLIKLKFHCRIRGTLFSFPASFTKTVADKPLPCFVLINWRPDVPDRFEPTEELVDNGYSVLSFCYTDVSSDDGDFTDGLAGVVYDNGCRAPSDCGKIGLWAWAALRVLDYAANQPEIDSSRISVVGHSRLGKAALLAGALDARFYCAFSNESGCCGAAISRQKQGEAIADIWKQFPFWFCQNLEKYAGKEEQLPFDQHFLLAANCPHRVYVASAAGDWWSGPENEYAACVLAAGYFQQHGLKTCVENTFPPENGIVDRGYIGYHIRPGEHYLSRTDWLRYMDYLKQENGQ